MSKNKTGNFIAGGKPQVPSLSSNNGIFDTKDVYTAASNNAWQEADGYYEIPRSLRIRGGNTQSITKSLASSSNRKTFTHSCWVKRGALTDSYLFFAWAGGNALSYQVLFENDCIRLANNNEGVSAVWNVKTTAVFRDPSAWYHIVVAIDTTQTLDVNRAKIYVNGVQITSFSMTSWPSQNFDNSWNNSAVLQQIGRNNTSGMMDGYMAEVYTIDGLQLDPSYFGYFDPVTNIWMPKPYTGSYGTNGFYLPFNDTLSLTNLGRNFAGSNYLTYSQVGNNASYTYNNASVTINNTTAPDGTTTGNLLTVDGTTNTHRFYKQFTTQPSGTVMCMSAFVKYSGTTKVVALENWTGSAGGQCFFDVSVGQPKYTATWPAGSGFQYVGNGWYRIWTTCNNAASNGSGTPSIALYACDDSGNLSWTGNNSNGFYFWGVQANLGTTPDPYIATTSSTSINDWTLNNFSLTAGATYDSMVDSPTNIGTTANDTGGVVTGNYATFNPLEWRTFSGSVGSPTLSNGNLTSTGINNSYRTTFSTLEIPATGKWKFEATIITDSNGTGNHLVGLVDENNNFPVYWSHTGGPAVSGQGSAATTFTAGDVITFEVNRTPGSNSVKFYKNGTVVLTTSGSDFSSVPMRVCHYVGSSIAGSIHMNFGQRPFLYGGTDFKSLNTTNLQAVGAAVVGNAGIQPFKWFDATLYTGIQDVTPRKIINSGFKPDLVWIKSRAQSISPRLYDTARGAGLSLGTNSTGADSSETYPGVVSFDDSGFTFHNTSSAAPYINEYNGNYVAWQWKQSPTSGFNVVSYTGNGASNRAISHNLGVAPSMIILKSRTNVASATAWVIGITSSGFTWSTDYFQFDTSAKRTNGAGTVFAQAPTSSNFYVGNSNGANWNGDSMIAYLWAEVPGFSKFGSYTGNGSADGPFVYTGFRPKYIIYKLTAGVTADWCVADSSRETYNPSSTRSRPNWPDADFTNTSHSIDFTSNGFKVRGTDNAVNYSGGTIIYAAFAESPFALNNRAR